MKINGLNNKQLKSCLAMVLGLGLVSLSLPSKAWWSTGHMVVAEIAYRRLTPAAKSQAERLLKLDALPDSATFQNVVRLGG